MPRKALCCQVSASRRIRNSIAGRPERLCRRAWETSCSRSLTVENDRGHESDVVEEFETYVTKDRVMIMNVHNF